MNIGVCTYCGRLTNDMGGICSLCQQRKNAKETAKMQSKPNKLDYWKQRAQELALKFGKVHVVVECSNGSYQVWPKALVGKEWKVVHETGDLECA